MIDWGSNSIVWIPIPYRARGPKYACLSPEAIQTAPGS